MCADHIISRFSKESPRNTVCIHTFSSPVGKIICAADTDFLYILTFEDSKALEKSFQVLSNKFSCKYIEMKNDILEETENEINEYFDGNLHSFSVPIKTFSTPFQKQLWEKIRLIPYGSTQTFTELAVSIGRPPNHATAIASSCHNNPVQIMIPCHRMIASFPNGAFRKGIDRKCRLINHEKNHSCHSDI